LAPVLSTGRRSAPTLDRMGALNCSRSLSAAAARTVYSWSAGAEVAIRAGERADLLPGAMALAVCLVLAGCTNEVIWEEEVRLNTGDTVTVRRTAVFERSGAPGNPFEMGWGVRGVPVIHFVWRGKTYAFHEHGRPFVLAISPQNIPTIVINPAIGRWDAKHPLPCFKPYYVQFSAGTDGNTWTWQRGIEPWLHHAPINLLQDLPKPDRRKSKYTSDEIRASAQSKHSEGGGVLDPSYPGLPDCPRELWRPRS
jgi:hypothetical protein